MNNEMLIEWEKTATKLAKNWYPAMIAKSKGGAWFDESDVRDFLIDLFLNRNGCDEIFEEKNRGRLHNYTLMFLQYNKDVLCYSDSIHTDDETDEDRRDFLSCEDADPAVVAEEGEFYDEAATYLNRITLIKDEGFSGALADIFGVTTRAGRNYAAASRHEKIYGIIMQAAKSQGLSLAEVRKLALNILNEARTPNKTDNEALRAFEEMFSLKKTTETKTKQARNRTERQKDHATHGHLEHAIA